MKEALQIRLMGSGSRDAGCEAGFEVLDQYAEAVVRGADVARLFPEVVAHLASCAACREDTEGLVSILRQMPPEEQR